METIWQYVSKLIIYLTYDPEMLTLDLYPREMNVYVHQKTCIWMFIIQTNTGNNQMSNSRINIQIVVCSYLLKIKENKLPTNVTMWVNLKRMLNQRSQTPKKAHTVWLHLYGNQEQENWSMLIEVWITFNLGQRGHTSYKWTQENFLGWCKCSISWSWKCVYR